MKRMLIILCVIGVMSAVGSAAYSKSNCEKVWGSEPPINCQDYKECAKTSLDGIKWSEVPDTAVTEYERNDCKLHDAAKGRDEAEKKFFYEACIKNLKIKKAKAMDIAGSYTPAFKKSLDDMKGMTKKGVLKILCSNQESCEKTYSEDDIIRMKIFNDALECKLREQNYIVGCWIDNCYEKWENKIELTETIPPNGEGSALVTNPSNFKIFLDKSKGDTSGLSYLDSLPDNKIVLSIIKPLMRMPMVSENQALKFAVRHEIQDKDRTYYKWDEDISCKFLGADQTIFCSNISIGTSMLYRSDNPDKWQPNTYQLMLDVLPGLKDRLDILFPFYTDVHNPLKDEIEVSKKLKIYESIATANMTSEFVPYLVLFDSKKLLSCVENKALSTTVDRDQDGVCDEIDSDIRHDGIINIMDPPRAFLDTAFPKTTQPPAITKENAIKKKESDVTRVDMLKTEGDSIVQQPTVQDSPQPLPQMPKEPATMPMQEQLQAKTKQTMVIQDNSGVINIPTRQMESLSPEYAAKLNVFELAKKELMSDAKTKAIEGVDVTSSDQERASPQEGGGGGCSLASAGAYNSGVLSLLLFGITAIVARKKS